MTYQGLMALRLQILGFALGSLLVSRAYPAGFTIAAVGAFGEELATAEWITSGCPTARPEHEVSTRTG